MPIQFVPSNHLEINVRAPAQHPSSLESPPDWRNLMENAVMHAAAKIVQPDSKEFVSRLRESAYIIPRHDSGIGKFHTRNPSLKIPLFFSRKETQAEKTHPLKKIARGAHLTHALGQTKHVEASGENLPLLATQGKLEREIRGMAATAVAADYAGEYVASLHGHIAAQLHALGAKSESGTIKVHLVRAERETYARDYTISSSRIAAAAELARSLNFAESRRQFEIKLGQTKGSSSSKRMEKELPASEQEMLKYEPKIRFFDIKKCSELHRFSAVDPNSIDNLVLQEYYDTSTISEGDYVVLVDEHVDERTVRNMASAVHASGAHVLAAAALTADPFSAHSEVGLAPDISTLLNTVLHENGKKEIQARLQDIGNSFETLTNREAMVLIAHLIDPKNEKHVSAFKAIRETYMGPESDFLQSELDARPMKPGEIAASLKEKSSEGSNFRSTLKPTPMQKRFIVDWDDCIRERKKLNLQLFWNAFATSAIEHQEDEPFLMKCLETFANTGPYAEGMPKVCMDMKNFSAYSISHDFGCNDMVRDFLKNLHALSPELAKELDMETWGKIDARSKMQFMNVEHMPEEPRMIDAPNPKILNTFNKTQKVINILESSFRRQYKELVRPHVDESRLVRPDRKGIRMPRETMNVIRLHKELRNYRVELRELVDKKSGAMGITKPGNAVRDILSQFKSCGADGTRNIALPYAQVKLELMPGAAAFIEYCRRPEVALTIRSNSEEGDIRDEGNILMLMDDFDEFRGVYQGRVTDKYNKEVIGRIGAKPDKGILLEIRDRTPGGPQVEEIYVGDQPKDLLQGNDQPHINRRGIFVNPNPDREIKTDFETKKFHDLNEAVRSEKSSEAMLNKRSFSTLQSKTEPASSKKPRLL
jgi:hypothetical protein